MDGFIIQWHHIPYRQPNTKLKARNAHDILLPPIKQILELRILNLEKVKFEQRHSNKLLQKREQGEQALSHDGGGEQKLSWTDSAGRPEQRVQSPIHLVPIQFPAPLLFP